MTISPQIPNSERTYLERSLRQMQQDVLRMGALVEQSFRLSHRCLFDRDLEVVATVTSLESRMDRYYRQI